VWFQLIADTALSAHVYMHVYPLESRGD